jgi:hypothetical protein
MKNIDLEYQKCVDQEAQLLLSLSALEIKNKEAFGQIEKSLFNKKVSIGWWHHEFDKDVHHIYFKLQRKVLFFLYKSYLNGVKLENDKVSLLTQEELGNYD